MEAFHALLSRTQTRTHTHVRVKGYNAECFRHFRKNIPGHIFEKMWHKELVSLRVQRLVQRKMHADWQEAGPSQGRRLRRRGGAVPPDASRESNDTRAVSLSAAIAAATMLQSVWRQTRATKAFRAVRSSTVALQTAWRQRGCMRKFQSLRCAATVGQKNWRAVSAQRRFTTARASAVVVQSRARGYLARARFSKARNAATAIQKAHERRCPQAPPRLEDPLHPRRVTEVLDVRGPPKRRFWLVQWDTPALDGLGDSVDQPPKKRSRPWRQRGCTRKFQSLRCAAIVGQKNWRAVSAQRRFATARASAVVVQNRVRGYLARARFSKARDAATAIQTAARRFASVKRFAVAKASAVRNFCALRSSVTSLQTRPHRPRPPPEPPPPPSCARTCTHSKL